MKLSGKTAIVTGGAVRIGREIARTLAREGVHLCLQYRSSAQEAQAATEELSAYGVNVTAIQADFASPGPAASSIIHHAAQFLGKIDFLINCAAIFRSGSLLDTTEENWDEHLTVNLKSPVFLMQEFVKQLAPEQSAAIVNIVDWRGTHPVPGHLAYTLAKSGLVAATQLLAQELGPRVRVNGVAPGAILPAPGTDETAFQQRGQLNCLKRVGNPQQIADAVRYLLSAEFVTGEILHVTGGEHL